MNSKKQCGNSPVNSSVSPVNSTKWLQRSKAAWIHCHPVTPICEWWCFTPLLWHQTHKWKSLRGKEIREFLCVIRNTEYNKNLCCVFIWTKTPTSWLRAGGFSQLQSLCQLWSEKPKCCGNTIYKSRAIEVEKLIGFSGIYSLLSFTLEKRNGKPVKQWPRSPTVHKWDTQEAYNYVK